MNTADAANELGVSTKTVQRWVKQLQLPASRNELGHYFFTEDDIAILKEVKEQLKNGTPMQDVTVKRPKKTFFIKKNEMIQTKEPAPQLNERLEERLQRFLEHEQLERELLQKKIAELERKLEQKADDVVSYQLLQQRRELEEERQQIKHLEQKISQLESMNRREKDTAGRREEKKPKSKLKSIFSF
ncbi:chromosome-anchoring protein RacA [Bacillus sp. FSL W8-0445]|jgi:chromosome-anchoring protein RacA|uniref:Chromosome-anchoring protein RacA n=1 Tax=Bacillus licheniformis TaxID=1402 RepID=A0A8B5YIN2_BACLI|nr:MULTISPECIES: chromosome-anchoring protein RacA [Bacillus]MBJ7888083.1 chromosome-anchoring protein RacA [Bacillaceae bacterium HSR45]AMR12286.1 MerR family transcriptional regulator [Bacillus licheniformis]ARC63550.1 chromosome-anchoring protein RacA [Bacillus licheniformis]ATI77994.1 MerR family transcriptional regulator [Bacillus licheniformis]AWV42559.1 MerR family transcriptional regulator [Bacillus licheniformis]